MKQVLLFGAGKSATVLIQYLLDNAPTQQWKLVIADANPGMAAAKLNNSPFGEAVGVDGNDAEMRAKLIASSDIVISMLPPALHAGVAMDCLRLGKNLLTASYVDDRIRKMDSEVKGKGLLFLCEMGLDPGIDHMSAMKLIHAIQQSGGKIDSFYSHCGGLVAPESDDNPWHYKISWNPRNIILAGKAGAHYRQDGKEVRLPYEELFTTDRVVEVPGLGSLCWYPNRDSLGYAPLYGLEETSTFIRTTLRHPDFMYGWKNVVELGLTDEHILYDTDGKTLAELFREHLDSRDFENWLKEKVNSRFRETRTVLDNLTQLLEAEKKAKQEGDEVPGSYLSADEKGNLQEIDIAQVKTQAAGYAAHRLHEANLVIKQFLFLGLEDHESRMDKGRVSIADILQFAAERKLFLGPSDKDMIVMLHEIGYEQGHVKRRVRSSLVVKGDDGLHTAMAKTVGLPLGIAAKLVLAGRLPVTGVQIPTLPSIYEPVLAELEGHGIHFQESTNFQ